VKPWQPIRPSADGRKKVPKPNPGKTGDDKNKHKDNENISSDSKKLLSAGYAYVHVAINPDRIDPEFIGYGSRLAVRGLRQFSHSISHAARRKPHAIISNVNI
jgi:hypothetical protein